MKSINCLGEMCPIPIVKLSQNVEAIKNGLQLQIITDHSCTLKAVEEFCRNKDLTMSYEEVMSGVWEILITSDCSHSGICKN